jgi:putative flippase GtrA
MHFLNEIYLKNSFNKHKTKIKFVLVGVWNTIFGFLVFVILYKLFKKIFNLDYFAYTSAQILGTFLAVVNAYICHKYLTFQSKVKGRKMIFEFLRFSTTYSVIFLLGLIIMPFLVEVLKIYPIVAGIILNIIVVFTSYFGHSRFSFNK